SGGDNYNWDNDLGEGETHTVSPLESTTYIVNVGSLANCFNSDTVLVTVNPVPSIDVTESTSICFGETSTISVLGEGDIDWNNNLGPQSSHDVSPEVTTTYEVQLSNEFTCFANASITITVHPVVETGLSGLSDTPYCSTDENAYNMIGSPAGGVYSGNGVEGNQFIPANAGIGALEITYSFEDEFGCEYNSTLMAEVDICDLVSEQDLLFELYPNPIQDELIIAHEGESKKIAKIQVYGLNGQLVLEKEVQGDGMPIKVNCSSLESGSYVLHLVGEGWTSNYSIIKE
ncbi:MAG: T9SS type A sorting domain-containing protein, partial [Flavobacteriales bacterium]